MKMGQTCFSKDRLSSREGHAAVAEALATVLMAVAQPSPPQEHYRDRD